MRELVATGERSGELPSVLREAGASYAREFDQSVKRALTLLGPAMILVMGMAVGYIVYAILLPLFELNQLIK
jgi:general secretion pathway protein F